MGLLEKVFGTRQSAPPPRQEPGISNLGGDFFSELSSVTRAGVAVNEMSAMQHDAVYACVQLLAGIVSTLPLHFYERGDTRKRINHDYFWLFNESACGEFTSAAMWEYGMDSRLLHGDMFAWLQRDRRGQVSAVVPLSPTATSVKRMGGWKSYTSWLPDGSVKTLHEDDVIHVPGLGFNGLRSLSPIRHFAGRSAVGLALAQDEFSERSLGQGNHSDLLLTSKAKLDPEQRRVITEELEARYSGLANTRRPMALSGEFTLERLRVNPVDMQLLEARQFSVVQIARLFGVPPHLIGATDKATSWGSGLESMTLGFIKFTLRRHLEAIQQELNRKLFPGDRRIYGEFVLDALQEGDSAAQAAYFGKALGGPGSQGWMTINEVRARKNMPPVPGGDKIRFAGEKKNGDSKPFDPSEESDGSGQDQGGEGRG